MNKKFFLVIGLIVSIDGFNNNIFAMDDNTIERPQEGEVTQREIDFVQNSEQKLNSLTSSLLRAVKIASDQLVGIQREVKKALSENKGIQEDTNGSSAQAENGLLTSSANENSGQKGSVLSGISFNKTYLKYFGVGAVGAVVFGGVVYVLYKNGTLKKFSLVTREFVKEHNIGIASVVATATVLLVAGLYVKKTGITLEQLQSNIKNIFVRKKTEAILLS